MPGYSKLLSIASLDSINKLNLSHLSHAPKNQAMKHPGQSPQTTHQKRTPIRWPPHHHINRVCNKEHHSPGSHTGQDQPLQPPCICPVRKIRTFPSMLGMFQHTCWFLGNKKPRNLNNPDWKTKPVNTSKNKQLQATSWLKTNTGHVIYTAQVILGWKRKSARQFNDLRTAVICSTFWMLLRVDMFFFPDTSWNIIIFLESLYLDLFLYFIIFSYLHLLPGFTLCYLNDSSQASVYKEICGSKLVLLLSKTKEVVILLVDHFIHLFFSWAAHVSLRMPGITIHGLSCLDGI